MKGAAYRVSTLAERKNFYEKEFSLPKVKKWFKDNKLPLPQLCAIDAGSDSRIIADKKYKNFLLYFRFKDLKEKIKKYIPEDVYYDRNIYKNPDKILESLDFQTYKSQELAFDIDVDNFHRNPGNESLKEAYDIALEMKNKLEKTFSRVVIVYSGRGFHLHVLDKKAGFLSINQREELNRKFSKFPIDPWVSRGNIRLIRMPFTLNSLVSRMAIPISKAGFIPENSYPKFLVKK